ncbi:hypothetical protein [Actinomyces sp. oral taxon 897]|uniref:hypothetical protein n=1 Tax=Actinomyces sp. oral taxon 897 TaxID=2081702 RepID=UPI000D037482|nr:hypothetical protein [Actinomyces sp. oral taxon 897]AVM61933.1 hypothetical protein C3V41_07515 [Actinomyces sp. oral taxon 897]
MTDQTTPRTAEPADPLDRVTVSWDGDTVLIVPGGTSAGTPDEALGRAPDGTPGGAPDGQAARESFLRPLVPLDGGWVVADLVIDKKDPVSVAGGFLTTTVPLWVELVYGYDVVLAAQQLLAEVEDAEDSRRLRLAREVPTTWHSAPTMTARVLCRIAQGLWLRRYWPSPADGSVRQLDRVALDMELIALSRKGDVPLCLAADGGVGALLLTPMAQEVKDRARDFIDNGVDETVRRSWGLVIASCLEGLLDAAEDEGDEEEAAALEELLDAVEERAGAGGGQHDELAALLGGSLSQDAVALVAGAGKTRGTFTIDWGQNVQGLFNTSPGAGAWRVAGTGRDRRVTVTVRTACELPRDSDVGMARVYVYGEILPVLVHLCATAPGEVSGAAPLGEGQEIELVDVVSVPRPSRPVRGSDRDRLLEEQKRADKWVRSRQRTAHKAIQQRRSMAPRLVRAGLKQSQLWVAELLAQFRC